MGERDWMIEINEKVKSNDPLGPKRPRHSIYKVPLRLTKLNEEAYKPRVVSFGPYHHGEEHLKGMEDHKCRALIHFLKRCKKPIEMIFHRMDQVVGELINSYDTVDPIWSEDKHKFVKMMILDGCFILEILRAYHQADSFRNDYDDDNDPVFGPHGKLYVVPHIKRDMLMLENQIPLMVLRILFQVANDISQGEELLKKQILRFLRTKKCDVDPQQIGECMHVLDVLRKGMIQQDPSKQTKVPKETWLKWYRLLRNKKDKDKERAHSWTRPRDVSESSSTRISGYIPRDMRLEIMQEVAVDLRLEVMQDEGDDGFVDACLEVMQDEGDEEEDEIIRSATELQEAGIRFKKSKTNSLRDVSFVHGVLRLPRLDVDDTTEYMFLNLIAFESLHVGAGNQVSAYVCFMDLMIDTEMDVALLHRKGIIINILGSDKAVAKMFNSLSKDVSLDMGAKEMSEVRKALSKYYRYKPWKKWRANLIQTYFRNPWASVSLIAAIFLFALTIVQTVYTVAQYYHSC